MSVVNVASSDANIFYVIYLNFTNYLSEYVSLSMGLMILHVRTYVITFVALYFVFFGYGVLTHKIKLDLKQSIELGISMLLLLVISFFTQNPSAYAEFFVNPTQDLMVDVANFFLSFGTKNDLESLFRHSLGTLVEQLFGLNYLIWKASTLTEPSTLIEASLAILLLTVPVLLMCGLFIFTFVIYTLNVYILYIVGPIYFYFLAFSKTRQYFWSWFKTLLVQIFNVLFSSIIIAVASFILGKILRHIISANIAKEIFSTAYLTAAFTAWACLYALMKATEITGQLTNSAPSQSGGIVAGMAGVGALMHRTGTGLLSKNNRAAALGQTKNFLGGLKGGARNAFNQIKGVPNG